MGDDWRDKLFCTGVGRHHRRGGRGSHDRSGLGTLDGPIPNSPWLIYQLPEADFNDVTTGNNGFAATPGYDLVTGRGTPNLPMLIPGLSGASSISGKVYNDLNNDGLPESGEFGLPNVTVFADLNNDNTLDPGDPVAVTDPNGHYVLSGLLPGTLTLIREIVPAGFTVQTGTLHRTASLLVNGHEQNVVGDNFGNRDGSISGEVFNDVNDDATLDNGETGIAGVTVFEDVNSDGIFNQTSSAQTFSRGQRHRSSSPLSALSFRQTP